MSKGRRREGKTQRRSLTEGGGLEKEEGGLISGW